MKTRWILFLAITTFCFWASAESVLQLTMASPVDSSTEEIPHLSRFLTQLTPQLLYQTTGFVGGDADSFTSRTGYGFAATTEVTLGDDFNFETGFLYREAGGSIREYYRGRELSDEIMMKYLGVPASVKYYFRLLNRTLLYAKAGLVGTILVSREESGLDSSFAVITNAHGSPLVDSFMPISLDGLAALGAKMSLGSRSKIVFETGCLQGFAPAIPKENFYNYSLYISAGLDVSLL